MRQFIYFRAAALTALTLAVAGCGSSGDDGPGSNNAAAPPDGFFAAVNAVVATSRDDTEPREVESITATSPEDSEPASLDS